MPRLTAQRRRVLAWTLAIAVVAAGFWRIENHFKENCEDANHFREEILPDAFVFYSEELGAELGGSAAQIEAFQERTRAEMEVRFPPRDCSTWL